MFYLFPRSGVHSNRDHAAAFAAVHRGQPLQSTKSRGPSSPRFAQLRDTVEGLVAFHQPTHVSQNQPPLAQHDEPTATLHRTQPVRDHQRGLVARQRINGGHHFALGQVVERAGEELTKVVGILRSEPGIGPFASGMLIAEMPEFR